MKHFVNLLCMVALSCLFTACSSSGQGESVTVDSSNVSSQRAKKGITVFFNEDYLGKQANFSGKKG